MAPVLVGTLLAFLTALVVTRLTRDIASRKGLVDLPDARKRHARAVPRLGGVGIAAGLMVGLVLATGLGPIEVTEALPLLLGAAAIAGLGFWDDLHGLGFKKRFLVQVTVAYAMVLSGWHVDVDNIPFLRDLGTFEQASIVLPLTLFWTVGLINAINLMDGLDGLAGGVSTVAFVAFLLAYMGTGDPLLLAMCAVAAAATAGFLVYNVTPASIFMGDTGSTLLGFLLAMAGLRATAGAPTPGLLAVPAVILGLPLLDTLTTMTRRMVHGNSPFLPDADHIHHRVLGRSRSIRGAVFALWGAGAVFGTIGVALRFSRGSDSIQALCVLLSVAFAYLVIRKLRYVRMRVLLRKIQRRRIHRRRARIELAAMDLLVYEDRGDSGRQRAADIELRETARV